jgi:hypothetical protein
MTTAAQSTDRAGHFAADSAAGIVADAVKDALSAMNKAVRFRRLYPPTHEFYRHALAELRDRFTAALEGNPEIRVEVGAQTFRYENSTVFTDERGPKNLPFRFFKDGIQSITFHKGVDEGEFERMLDALHVDLECKGMSPDDLAILLWNADLHRISFFAIDELDPDVARRAAEGGATPEGETETRPEVRELAARVEEIVERLGEPMLPVAAAELAKASGFIRQLSVGSRELHEVERGDGFPAIEQRPRERALGAGPEPPSQEEASFVLREPRDESDLARRTIRIARWLVEKDELVEDMNQTLDLVSDLMGRLIDDGRLDILQATIGEMRTNQAGASERTRVFMGRLTGALAAPERVDSLLRLVNGRKIEDKELRSLVNALPNETLEEIAALYSKVRNEDARAVILAVLLERAPVRPEILRPVVAGVDARAAREAMKALKALEATWALETLLLGLESPDPDIRRDAMKAVPDDRLDDYVPQISSLLGDASPTVRSLAIRKLADAATPPAVEALRKRLGTISPDLVPERIALLRAVALSDPWGAEILWNEAGGRRKRFRFLSAGALDPLRAGLMDALRTVTTPAAKEYLRRCARSDDAALRKVATDMLGGNVS